MIHFSRLLFSLALGAMLATATASATKACEKGEPCETQTGWFASFNTFGLRMMAPAEGEAGQSRGYYSSTPGADLQLASDWKENGVAKHSEAIIVGGRVLIARGLEIPDEFAFDAIEEAFVTASFGAALLAEAFPQGAASLKPHNEIKIENGSHLIETAAAGDGGAFAGPWDLTGVADKSDAGRVTYQLRFKSKKQEATEQRRPGPETIYDIELSGYFENETPAFALKDDASLKGWKIFGEDVQGRDLADASIETVGQLRKIIHELAARDAEPDSPAPSSPAPADAAGKAK